MRSKYRRAHDVLLYLRYPDTALFVLLLGYIAPAAVSVSGVAMAYSTLLKQDVGFFDIRMLVEAGFCKI